MMTMMMMMMMAAALVEAKVTAMVMAAAMTAVVVGGDEDGGTGDHHRLHHHCCRFRRHHHPPPPPPSPPSSLSSFPVSHRAALLATSRPRSVVVWISLDRLILGDVFGTGLTRKLRYGQPSPPPPPSLRSSVSPRNSTAPKDGNFFFFACPSSIAVLRSTPTLRVARCCVIYRHRERE
jgi:hypothetical protein